MGRFWLSGVALAALIGCDTPAPYSNPGAIEAHSAQRDTALAQSPGQPVDVVEQPLPSGVIDAVNNDPAEANAAAQAAAANSGVAPVEASPANPQPVAVNDAGISSEQDFDAVSSQRTIESDAQKIANNRAQYTVIEPTDLPTRAGTDQPNIVQYALQTTNPVGAPLYRRVSLRSANATAKACARFQSPDQAQTEFLSRGGPERDRRGLDPDGDGFACSWDPTPFRNARAAAQPTVATPLPTEPPVSQAPVDSTASTTATPPSSSIVPPLVISTE